MKSMLGIYYNISTIIITNNMLSMPFNDYCNIKMCSACSGCRVCREMPDFAQKSNKLAPTKRIEYCWLLLLVVIVD